MSNIDTVITCIGNTIGPGGCFHALNSTVASDTKATVGMPQLSASSVTTVISGAGTAALHPAKLIGAGLEAVGGVLSSVLVMVW